MRALIESCVLLLLSSVAMADEGTEPDLEVVVVTGEQPGPGLWKVTSKSGFHELWILGEVSPFTRQVKWQPREFDKVLRSSQELLLDFSGYWEADKSDMATYRRAETLPKGTTLRDLI